MSDRPFYSARDLADRWGLGLETVRRMLRRGDIAVVRFGTMMRISHEALQQFEQRQTTLAKQDRPAPDRAREEGIERFRSNLHLQRAVERYRSGSGK